MVGDRQKQGADVGVTGKALQFRAIGRCEKLRKASLGAVRIGKVRRGMNAPPKRQLLIVSGRSIAHAAFSGLGRASGTSSSRR